MAVHYFNFGAWNKPLEDQEEEEERLEAGVLEAKGCHLRRGGRKKNLKRTKASRIFKAKAVDLEHS